jgi:tetratricopeptide (TPR) repeat protein
VPRIDAQYRTVPFRTLVGHSLGGLFTLYAFLSPDSPVQAYLAIDPSLWWDNKVIEQQAKQAVVMGKPPRGIVFLGLGHNPHPSQLIVRSFADLMREKAPGCRLGLKDFPEEGHGSVPLLAWYEGFKFIFKGYKPDLNALSDKPSLIPEHFKDASRQIGFTFGPPEDLVHEIAINSKPDQALECLKLNVELYPKSCPARVALGQACASRKQNELAAEQFRRALELEPGNREAMAGLKALP